MQSINEKCAVIGVTNTHEFDVSRLAYLGLWALQHRGQDSSGISSFDGKVLRTHKKHGLVSQVYSEESLNMLKGKVAIGHNRYSTSGGKDAMHNQPYSYEALDFAFAHNGNLPFTTKLEDYLHKNQIKSKDYNDSGLMFLALANELKNTNSIEDALRNCWNLFTGAFSCVGLYKDTMFAFRDGYGIRPLAIGKTGHGYVVASETVALDIIRADYEREVEPGELVLFKGETMESRTIVKGRTMVDAFEFIYLARPDSRIAGRSVYSARYQAGKALARVMPVSADIVIGTPDSGLSAATGYAHESEIPFEYGLLKNRYIGRTFIEPEKIRKSSIELKFNVIVESVANKDIILVDDSLVRGNTLSYVVSLLRSYGAKKIHVRIASPPIKFADFYGIDTPSADHLIASENSLKEIQEIIQADSLAYLPIYEFIKSTGLSKTQLNLSSFNGVYPIPVPKSQ